MRRKDREMSKDFAVQLIDASRYGVLSIVDVDGLPYGIPLSIVRKDHCLYFHSAKAGKKVGAFTDGKVVCATFVGRTHIPELYTEEELTDLLADETKGTLLARRVFTTEYESAIVFGRINLVEDVAEKIEALRLVCQKYTPTKMPYFDLAIKSSLLAVNVYRIDIEQITAKRKRFDSSGIEMKWGRMEE